MRIFPMKVVIIGGVPFWGTPILWYVITSTSTVSKLAPWNPMIYHDLSLGFLHFQTISAWSLSDWDPWSSFRSLSSIFICFSTAWQHKPSAWPTWLSPDPVLSLASSKRTVRRMQCSRKCRPGAAVSVWDRDLAVSESSWKNSRNGNIIRMAKWYNEMINEMVYWCSVSIMYLMASSIDQNVSTVKGWRPTGCMQSLHH